MKRIPVGIITNAEGAHLGAYFEALARTEEVEAVFLADPSGATIPQATKVLGEKLKTSFRDSRQMLREAKPVMTVVSIEAALAPPEIDAALDAGCHVFAEKPSCVRVEDFTPLVQKADGKHLNLMLALANRINPPVREARRLMAAGLLGKVYGVEMHIVADQTRLKRPEYHKTWFASKARGGGGHLIWLGLHWLDLAGYITGLKVKEVSALTAVVGGQPIDVEDSAAVVMRFDNGSLGTLTSGYYLDKGYHTHIKIWGEHGWLELAGGENGPLEYYSTKAGQTAKVERFEPQQGQGGYTPFVRAAVRACAGLEAPPITGQESLQVLKTVFASYQAADSGQRQTVN
ncbi:MAG: gfo 8 [Planctomycetaceae bacterium]|nr:gfo 8 [Planctomycetaceae bacterium]